MVSIYQTDLREASGPLRVTPLTIEVLTNHLELHIESKRVNASCIRFCGKV